MEAAGMVGDPAASVISAATREQNIRILGLVEQLGNTQFRERESAHTQLQRLGITAAPYLVEGLGSPELEARRRSISLLNRLGGDAVPALIQGLRSDNQEVRRSATSMLGQRVEDLGNAPFPDRASWGAFVDENNQQFRPRPLSGNELERYISKGPQMLAAMEAWMQDPANAATIRELRSIAAAGEAGG